MTKQVPWNKIILEEFIELACLNKLEQNIMRTRIEGWTISKQSMEFHMSESSIKKIIANLKLKYDSVQKYSKILPQRKSCAKEIFMDNN